MKIKNNLVETCLVLIMILATLGMIDIITSQSINNIYLSLK